MTVNDYIEKVIKQGDEGSSFLRARTAPTLSNSEFVEVIGNNAVLRLPADHLAVVYSLSADPAISDPQDHAASLVDRLVRFGRSVGTTPIGLANVVDTPDGSLETLESVSMGLVDAANQEDIVILNGENAVLGSRVNAAANISGTAIAVMPKRFLYGDPQDSVRSYQGVPFALFDHGGDAVFVNADGIGTKTEIYERAGLFEMGLDDFLAMNLDDTIKAGALARVVSGVTETLGSIPFKKIQQRLQQHAEKMKIQAIIHHERVGRRIQGIRGANRVYNINGAVVSTIDEDRLANPLKSEAGDYLIAVWGDPNPRSNGISSRRRVVAKHFGAEWHRREDCRDLIAYLSSPSTVLYPVFKDLVDGGLATNVYHMSGGAYNGKLAKPLAQQGLFVKLEDLPNLPDPERKFIEISSISAQDAYAQWPMGIDGFVTIKEKDLGAARTAITALNLGSAVVGQLITAGSKSGVQLTAFNGETVYFSGK